MNFLLTKHIKLKGIALVLVFTYSRRGITEKFDAFKRLICRIPQVVINEWSLGHGRLIFRMTGLWRAIFVESVNREIKNKKKLGESQFYFKLQRLQSVGRGKNQELG